MENKLSSLFTNISHFDILLFIITLLIVVFTIVIIVLKKHITRLRDETNIKERQLQEPIEFKKTIEEDHIAREPDHIAREPDHIEISDKKRKEYNNIKRNIKRNKKLKTNKKSFGLSNDTYRKEYDNDFYDYYDGFSLYEIYLLTNFVDDLMINEDYKSYNNCRLEIESDNSILSSGSYISKTDDHIIINDNFDNTLLILTKDNDNKFYVESKNHEYEVYLNKNEEIENNFHVSPLTLLTIPENNLYFNQLDDDADNKNDVFYLDENNIVNNEPQNDVSSFNDNSSNMQDDIQNDASSFNDNSSNMQDDIQNDASTFNDNNDSNYDVSY